MEDLKMKDNSIDQPIGVRKPYRKPKVLKVNLMAKEAVLSAGCKTTGYSASASLNSCNPTPVPTCRENGS